MCLKSKNFGSIAWPDHSKILPSTTRRHLMLKLKTPGAPSSIRPIHRHLNPHPHLEKFIVKGCTASTHQSLHSSTSHRAQFASVGWRSCPTYQPRLRCRPEH